MNSLPPAPSDTDDTDRSLEHTRLAAANARLLDLVEDFHRLRGSRVVGALSALSRSRPARVLRGWLEALTMRQSTDSAVEWAIKIAEDGDQTRSAVVDEAAFFHKLSSSSLPVIAIGHPHWRGVRSSSENLFDFHLFVTSLSQNGADSLARRLALSNCSRVVFQGFPPTYERFVTALHRYAPHIRKSVIWHGSFMQIGEHAEWYGLRTVLEGVRHGYFERIGFVKEGMAEVFRREHTPAFFVMNYVQRIPEKPSVPMQAGPHFGLWAIEPIWRKLPYAMVAGASLIPDAHTWSSGENQRAEALAALLNIRYSRLAKNALPRTAMAAALARMHVNLYVTLSECAPMLPLESLAVGAPCLMGPNSHYFRDYNYLSQRLIVAYPDNPQVIADAIQVCLRERNEIIAAYGAYAPNYAQRARAALASFLDT